MKGIDSQDDLLERSRRNASDQNTIEFKQIESAYPKTRPIARDLSDQLLVGDRYRFVPQKLGGSNEGFSVPTSATSDDRHSQPSHRPIPKRWIVIVDSR
jgi:hypothetical protein